MKYHFTITLRSNYENRYELNLDKIWETIKAHYESQNIPNIYFEFRTHEWQFNTPTLSAQLYTLLVDGTYEYEFLSRVLSFRSHVTVEDLIQKINQYIDSKL